MSGKAKCKALKQIREQIAQENDIPYVVSQCTFQGECKGTCPKCEAELAYLEEQLEKRRKTGKRIAVAGISVALIGTATHCAREPLKDFFKDKFGQTITTGAVSAFPEGDELTGDVTISPDTTESDELTGDVAIFPEPTECDELTGDVVMFPDDGELEKTGR
ncbi:MAG: hypothetical protein E7258_02690 [Lachnospiraceae bacterium]|nr:hypothetical protein [Lachnospiraceae bacterium]